MTFYAAYIYDGFTGERIFIGMFDTIGRAEEAMDIVLKHSKNRIGSDVPDGRFACFWDPVRINEFDVEELSSFLY